MAIKIINGKAVVVPDEESTLISPATKTTEKKTGVSGIVIRDGKAVVSDEETPKETIKTSTTKSQPSPITTWFKEKAPREIPLWGETILGMFPGGAEAYEKIRPDKPFQPMDPISYLKTIGTSATKVPEWGLNVAKWIGGIPVRLKRSILEQLTGQPEATGVPTIAGKEIPFYSQFVGPQPTYQEQHRQFEEAGYSPVTSYGLPTAAAIFDILGGKGVLSKGKAMIKGKPAPVIPKTEVPVAKTPVETFMEKPQTVGKPPGYFGAEFLRKQYQAPTEPSAVEQFLLPAEAGSLKKPIILPSTEKGIGMGKPMYDVPAQFKVEKPFEVIETKTRSYTPKDYAQRYRETVKKQMAPELKKELPKEIEDVPADELNQRFALEALERARNWRRKSAVKETPKNIIETMKEAREEPKMETMIEDIVKKEYKPNTGFKGIMERVFSNSNDRLHNMGPSADKLVTTYETALANEGTIRGENYLRIKTFPKLSEQQKNVLYEVTNGRATTTDPTVLKAAEMNRQLARNFHQGATKVGVLVDDATGMPIGNPETYFPIQPNESAIKILNKRPNEFFKRMATVNKIKDATTGESRPMTEGEFRRVWEEYINPQRTPKAGFEYERKFKYPDEWIEKDPMTAWTKYNHDYARRIALAEQWGPNYELTRELIGKVGEETGNQYNVKFAKDFVDLVTNRKTRDIEGETMISNLMKRAVHTKLTPLQALPNMQQGAIANAVAFGPRYMAYGILKAFTPSGRRWAERTGVVGEGFYTDFTRQNKIWSRASGFPMTEDFNLVQVANGAKLFLEDMYRRVLKNPKDEFAKKQLDYYKVQDWRKSVGSGTPTLSDKQLSQGAFTAAYKAVFPKLLGLTPEWTQNPIGRATYLFGHYQMQQPKFLLSQFKFGKIHGLKALATAYVVGGILGEIPADVAAYIRKEDRPENALARFSENALTVTPPGWVYQLVKNSIKFGAWAPELFPLGGAAIGGPTEFAQTMLQDVAKESKREKLPEDFLRQWLKGNIPVGPQIPTGSLLEKLWAKEQ